MKKTIVVRVLVSVLIAAVVCLSLCGCDDGLKWVKMEVHTEPEKTTYTVGEDHALDFQGGTVLLETLSGSTEIFDMQEYTWQEKQIKGSSDIGRYISSDVNFYLPGEYVVTVWQTSELSCQFTVTVAESP